jgi:hypothetical protein
MTFIVIALILLGLAAGARALYLHVNDFYISVKATSKTIYDHRYGTTNKPCMSVRLCRNDEILAEEIVDTSDEDWDGKLHEAVARLKQKRTTLKVMERGL